MTQEYIEKTTITKHGWKHITLTDPKRYGEQKQMKTLKEYAQEYVKPIPKTVADAPKISTSVQIFEKTSRTKDDKPFKYNFILINDEEHRVPSSVVEQLQKALKFNPSLEYFKVTKKITGTNDIRYEVEPV